MFAASPSFVRLLALLLTVVCFVNADRARRIVPKQLDLSLPNLDQIKAGGPLDGVSTSSPDGSQGSAATTSPVVVTSTAPASPPVTIKITSTAGKTAKTTSSPDAQTSDTSTTETTTSPPSTTPESTTPTQTTTLSTSQTSKSKVVVVITSTDNGNVVTQTSTSTPTTPSATSDASLATTTPTAVASGSSNTGRVVGGIVGGIAGAIVLIGLGLVAWRIWGRNKGDKDDGDDLMMGTAAEKANPALTSTPGTNPFQSTLESYHNPRVNASSNF